MTRWYAGISRAFAVDYACCAVPTLLVLLRAVVGQFLVVGAASHLLNANAFFGWTRRNPFPTVRVFASVLRRYPTEVISQLIITIAMYYGLVVSTRYVSNAHVSSDRLGLVSIGYVLWMLAWSVIGNMGTSVSADARTGTLEQLCLARVDLGMLLGIRALVTFVIAGVSTAGVALVVLGLSGHAVHIVPIDIVPVVLAGLSAVGVGYTMGGLTLLTKRTAQALNFLQFLLLFLIMIRWDRLGTIGTIVSTVAPVAPMVAWVDGLSLPAHIASVHAAVMVAAAINILLWGTIGYVVFSRAYAAVLRRGSLNHY